MFKLDIDISEFTKLADPQHQKQIEEAVRKEGEKLAFSIHNKVVEEAKKVLHSRQALYLKHLKMEQVGTNTYVITLYDKLPGDDERAAWIEDGKPQGEMIDDMLKSPKAKTTKDGTGKYLVVPFEHKKIPTQQTQAQTDLTDTIRQQLGARKIPYDKIETDKQGKPKLGVLHRFSIDDGPAKTHNGPGQGHGPIGAVRQGPTGIPFLRGVQVSQREKTDSKGNKILDANGKPEVEKHIMTFRIVSSKHKGTGRWVHPGLQGAKAFDKAYDWAMQKWDTEVKPQLEDWIKKL